MTAHLLVVDDDHNTTSLFEGLTRNMPVDVAVAYDGASARRLFHDGDFNLVLMDQRLPDANGLELLREMRRERPRQVCILMTGYTDLRDALAAVREGVFDYLTKPFQNLEELEAVIAKALEFDRAYREIETLRRRLDETAEAPVLIGRSPVMERLLQQIQQVAPLEIRVLLEGESGTGKEVAARLIHAASGRSRGPFIEINCGGLAEPLLESTLFGYERGAFTGAVKSTPGCFERADGGTLFLDEIADMSPKLQSTLLRVLQEQTFSRLGGTTLRSSDFRLVCATNQPLDALVKAHQFREDLFYRVNVVAFTLPPLRHRGSDIVLLAMHFLDHFNTKFGKSVGPFAPEACRLLENHSWPGNVRELQHLIERVVALHPGGPIGPADLADIFPLDPSAASRNDALRPYHAAREEFERRYLARLLEVSGGNVSEAARLSGIPRQNLYVRMRRWGIVARS